MALALGTYVPIRSTRTARAPARRRVSTALDEQALRLALDWAERRAIPLSAWLIRAARYCAGIERAQREDREYLTSVGETITEEEARRIDQELDGAGIPEIIPYTPSGPRWRVSMMVDETTLGEFREAAGDACLSLSGWLARCAWIYAQIDEAFLAQEEHSAEFQRHLDALAKRLAEGQR